MRPKLGPVMSLGITASVIGLLLTWALYVVPRLHRPVMQTDKPIALIELEAYTAELKEATNKLNALMDEACAARILDPIACAQREERKLSK